MDFLTIHTPVLLHEAIDGLAIEPGDTIVDATLGGGGHSEEILKRFAARTAAGELPTRLICLDADPAAIERAKKRLALYISGAAGNSVTFIRDNFRNLAAVLDSLGISKVNKVLFDLGTSSDQIERSGRGFSFANPTEPLDMTLAGAGDVTAKTIVNQWSEETLETILRGYGEERYARAIAKGIIEARRNAPIEAVGQLVDIIRVSTPHRYHHGRIHPATRTFQALRIAANDELRALEEGISAAFARLASGGRIAAISFHSLEDRIVKRFSKEKVLAGLATLVTKKPIVPTDAEIALNRRSRSAKLRIFQKI